MYLNSLYFGRSNVSEPKREPRDNHEVLHVELGQVVLFRTLFVLNTKRNFKSLFVARS